MKISTLEKMRAPSRNVFCEGLGCETLTSARLLGSDDDDLLRSAHHLRGLRDRVLHPVCVGRDGLHREHLAVLGDLLREPVRDDLLHLRLPVLGLQRVAESAERADKLREANPSNLQFPTWCEKGELNPRLLLGKQSFYH